MLAVVRRRIRIAGFAGSPVDGALPGRMAPAPP